MKAIVNVLFYLALVCLLTIIVSAVLIAGQHFELPLTTGYRHFPIREIDPATTSPIVVLLGQVIVIVFASMLCGLVFKRLGQPRVVGEIIAGILLGPSVLGRLFPAAERFIFPSSSLPTLHSLSQIGLILFMFIVGMEADHRIFKKKMYSALFISQASIAVPFGIGIILSYFLYRSFAPDNVPFFAFFLFIGIAMSITAFPVLAGIIRDKGLSGTYLGNMAITCAASDDITAWCLLAVVLSVVAGGSLGSAGWILGAIGLYAAIMLLIVRPMLNRTFARRPGTDMNGLTLTLIFLLLLISALCSEWIGIHVLFGAFFAGICMPDKPEIKTYLRDRIGGFSMLVLLPLFFAYTGLRTQVGLLDSPRLWLTCVVIILAAVAGKFGGSAMAARLTGESLKTSLALGVLMNTRGMVELVVLNIGYDIGILTPRLFTMFVLMALVTTFMTSPLFNLVCRMRQE
jgi:Kef-type K+ transport system membrane component KefB